MTMLEIWAIGNECMKTALEIYANGNGRVKN